MTNVVDLPNRFQTCLICEERYERPAYPNVSGCCDDCFRLVCDLLRDNPRSYWEGVSEMVSQRLFESLTELQQDALLQKMFNMVEHKTGPT